MQSYLMQIWQQVDITVVFITHDLDEAVYLADRVLVLDRNPGRVNELMEVPVPHPRDPKQFLTPEFLAAKARLEELIHPQRQDGVTDRLPMLRMTPVGDDVI
jgi:NitT/TauT family transport system ATP-binding protein